MESEKWRREAALVGRAEVVAWSVVVGGVGSGSISRAVAGGGRPSAGKLVGVVTGGDRVRVRGAVGCVEPVCESGNAFGRHGDNAGVGAAGSVVSMAARESKGAIGVGCQMAGCGGTYEMEECIVGLRVRRRAVGGGAASDEGAVEGWPRAGV